jgi:hypothetical protein
MSMTGKYSHKLYQCSNCQHKHLVGTNHWGETYGRCPNCAWKTPGQIFPQICLEPIPDGYTTPPAWKIVKLGDVADIRQGSFKC